MKQFHDRPFIKGLLFIPLLLICVIAMKVFFPEGSFMGFTSFIMAFEFANSPTYINELFHMLDSEALKRVDIGNYIDYLFMLVYTGLLVYIIYQSKQFFMLKWLKWGFLLCAFILIGDAVENWQLLKITETYQAGTPNIVLVPFLKKLQLFTWLKWTSLAIVFLMLSRVFIAPKSNVKWAGYFLLLPTITLLIANLMNRAPLWLDIFTGSIFLSFGVLLVVCFFLKNKALSS